MNLEMKRSPSASVKEFKVTFISVNFVPKTSLQKVLK